jgi:hypothetical protein
MFCGRTKKVTNESIVYIPVYNLHFTLYTIVKLTHYGKFLFVKIINSLADIQIKFIHVQGRIQDFKLGGGGALKKIAKMFGVFRVKNHDFTPKNLIFSSAPPWIRPFIRHL